MSDRKFAMLHGGCIQNVIDPAVDNMLSVMETGSSILQLRCYRSLHALLIFRELDRIWPETVLLTLTTQSQASDQQAFLASKCCDRVAPNKHYRCKGWVLASHQHQMTTSICLQWLTWDFQRIRGSK